MQFLKKNSEKCSRDADTDKKKTKKFALKFVSFLENSDKVNIYSRDPEDSNGFLVFSLGLPLEETLSKFSNKINGCETKNPIHGSKRGLSQNFLLQILTKLNVLKPYKIYLLSHSTIDRHHNNAMLRYCIFSKNLILRIL